MKEASDAGFQIAHYTLSGEKGKVEEIFLSPDALDKLRSLRAQQSAVEFQAYSTNSFRQSETSPLLTGNFIFKKPVTSRSAR